MQYPAIALRGIGNIITQRCAPPVPQEGDREIGDVRRTGQRWMARWVVGRGGDAQISEGWGILRREAWEGTVGGSHRTGHRLEIAVVWEIGEGCGEDAGRA